ncbi:MAG: corrinoid protein [Acidobacteriia bacterium]|nr:corrinoid protein [Terriglobia bacterium]
MSALYDAVLTGDATAAAEAVRQGLESGAAPLDLVEREMVPAMDEVGRRFGCEEYFVPDLLLAARAMKTAMEQIRPLLAASGAHSAGRVIVGTVKGDLHDIGKNIVASMLEGGGFEVIDLGIDVPPQTFVEAVRRSSPDLVCLSALLTVTMTAMKSTIEALQAADLRDKAKVLVGGAPVTQRFADEIGADGYGENAVAAVTLARRLMEARQPA